VPALLAVCRAALPPTRWPGDRKGVRPGDFSETLAAILAPEYAGWNQRSLAGKQYGYVCADGMYCNVRLDGSRQCILVLLDTTAASPARSTA
jgi:hypothetical protein